MVKMLISSLWTFRNGIHSGVTHIQLQPDCVVGASLNDIDVQINFAGREDEKGKKRT